MKTHIHPFTPKGAIEIHSSKSYCHRYLIAAFICNKPVTIKNIYFSKDINSTLKALQDLGGKFEIKDNEVTFVSRETKETDIITIDAGVSASTLRMILPIACHLYDHVKFVGSKLLFNRPLFIYEEFLDEQGILYYRTDTSIEVKGKVEMFDFKMRGDVSSQFVSGLLFLMALENSELALTLTTHLESTNYVEMTLNVLKEFGYNFDVQKNKYSFKSQSETSLNEIEVEKDFSIFANYAVLASLNGLISFPNMNLDSVQGDKTIIEILKKSNANMTFVDGVLTFSYSKLTPFKVDISNCIDLGPILFVLASLIEGTSTITGIKRLRIKESDRVQDMIDELSKAEVEYSCSENSISITGKNNYKGGYVFNPHNDHRIAMALAVFSANCDSKSTILDSECVEKSYPDFFIDLDNLK